MKGLSLLECVYVLFKDDPKDPELVVVTPHRINCLKRSAVDTTTKNGNTTIFAGNQESDAVKINSPWDFAEEVVASYPNTWILVVTIHEDELNVPHPPALLQSRVGRVACFYQQKADVVLPRDCEGAWVNVLKRNECIPTPQYLVVHIMMEAGLLAVSSALAALIAECEWLGEHQLAKFALSKMFDQLMREKSAEGVNKVRSPSPLKIRYRPFVQKIHDGSTMLQAELTMQLAKPLSTKMKAPVWIIAIFSHDPYREVQPLQEVEWLLDQFGADDRLFALVAGEVVIPPIPIQSAAAKLAESKMAKRGSGEKVSSPVKEMQIMWSKAAQVALKWRQELIINMAKLQEDGNLLPQIGVLFFLPRDCRIVYEALVLPMIQQNAVFFYIPVFCIATTTHIANVHLVLDICTLTHTRIRCPNKMDKHEKGLLLNREEYNRLLFSVLEDISLITYQKVSLVVLSRDDIPNCITPLEFSETYGYESIVFPQNKKIGMLLLLGTFSPKWGGIVYIQRVWKDESQFSQPNLAGNEMTVISMYSTQNQQYDILPCFLEEKEEECSHIPGGRWWWESLLQVYDWLQKQLVGKGTLTSPHLDHWLEKCKLNFRELSKKKFYQSELLPFFLEISRIVPNSEDQRSCLLLERILKSFNFPSDEFKKAAYNKRDSKTKMKIQEESEPCSDSHKETQATSNLELAERNVDELVQPTRSSRKRKFVDLLWTKFAEKETVISSLEDIFTNLCPYMNDSKMAHKNETLELKRMRNGNAIISTKSVVDVPELSEAKECVIVLFQVDSVTRIMTREKIIEHMEIIPKEQSTFTLTDLAPDKEYCVVHLVLRRHITSSVMANDLIVVEGIVFKTYVKYVKDLRCVRVKHDTVELAWEENIGPVRLNLTPLPWHIPSGTSKNTTSMDILHENSSRCVINGLQPCTLYHVKALLEDEVSNDSIDHHYHNANETLNSTNFFSGEELYFATCIFPQKNDLIINSTRLNRAEVKLSLSYPIFFAMTPISNTYMITLEIIPKITIDPQNKTDEVLEFKEIERKGNQCVCFSGTVKASQSYMVYVSFEMTLDVPHGNLTDSHDQTPICVYGFQAKVGPFQTQGNLIVTQVSHRKVQIREIHAENDNDDDDGGGSSASGNRHIPAIISVVPLYGYKESSDEARTISIDSNKVESHYIIKNLLPCHKYAVYEQNVGVNPTLPQAYFCTRPSPPSSSKDVYIFTKMAERNLYVEIPQAKDNRRFLTAFIEPSRQRVSNQMASVSLILNYESLQRFKPLIVSLEDSWITKDSEILRSEPTCMFAVTNVCCFTAPNGEKVLAWTCAACKSISGTGIDMKYSVNTLSNTQSKVCLQVYLNGAVCARNPPGMIFLKNPEDGQCAPILLSFHGPHIIPEKSPIFILLPPPSLTESDCHVETINEGSKIRVCVSVHFIKKLHCMIANVQRFVSVMFVTNTGDEVELSHEEFTPQIIEISIHPSLVSFISISVMLRLHTMGDEKSTSPEMDWPVMLVPWTLRSKSFELFRVMDSKPIMNLSVKSVHSFSALLTWSRDDANDTTNDIVYMTLRQTTEKSTTVHETQKLLCLKPAYALNNLEPSSMYVITLSRHASGLGAACVEFVTPYDVTDSMLRDFFKSMSVIPPENSSSYVSHVSSKDSFRIKGDNSHHIYFSIPRPQSKILSPSITRKVSFDAIGEVVECHNVKHLNVRGHMRIIAHLSGISSRVFSDMNASMSQVNLLIIPVDVSQKWNPWPRLNVAIISRTWWEESPSEPCNLPTTPAPQLLSKSSERIVDIVGCPKLKYVGENEIILEWSGSCNTYHVRWRVASKNRVYSETVIRKPNEDPLLHINTSEIDMDILLFCIYSAESFSNCSAFCVLVPPKPRRIPLIHLASGGACAELSSGLKSALVRLQWSAYIGNHQRTEKVNENADIGKDRLTAWNFTAEELHAGISFVGKIEILDTSLLVWGNAFCEVFKEADHRIPPLPPTIVWLNPTISVCFPAEL